MNDTQIETRHNPEAETELALLRQQIDDIDEAVIEQIIKRIAIVKKVGELKKRTSSAPCPIRPRREAEMLRKIVERFRNTDFPAVAAASIWRIIIGASTSVESDMTLSVLADKKENRFYLSAREYFGIASPIIKQAHINRIIGDVTDGKAAVGIIPFPGGDDQENKWSVLLQQGENTPKIFARIPFVIGENSGKDYPPALALARLEPEPSGDDMSIIAIEAEANVSQNKLQTAFSSAGLEASWLSIANIAPGSRHHLLEIKGFVDKNHEIFAATISSLGASILGTYFLGTYAVPVTIQ